MFTSKQRPMPTAYFPEGSRLMQDVGAWLFAQNRVLESLKMEESYDYFLNMFGRPGGYIDSYSSMFKSQPPLLITDETWMTSGYVESLIAMNDFMLREERAKKQYQPALIVPPLKKRPYQSKLCYEFALGDFMHTVSI